MTDAPESLEPARARPRSPIRKVFVERVEQVTPLLRRAGVAPELAARLEPAQRLLIKAIT